MEVEREGVGDAEQERLNADYESENDDGSTDEGEFFPHEILLEKEEDGVVKYLVLWEDWPLGAATWEPAEHLEGNTPILERWERDKRRIRLGKRPKFPERKYDKALDDWLKTPEDVKAKEVAEAKRERERKEKLGIYRGDASEEDLSDDGEAFEGQPSASDEEKDSPKRRTKKGAATKTRRRRDSGSSEDMNKNPYNKRMRLSTDESSSSGKSGSLDPNVGVTGYQGTANLRPSQRALGKTVSKMASTTSKPDKKQKKPVKSAPPVKKAAKKGGQSLQDKILANPGAPTGKGPEKPQFASSKQAEWQIQRAVRSLPDRAPPTMPVLRRPGDVGRNIRTTVPVLGSGASRQTSATMSTPADSRKNSSNTFSDDGDFMQLDNSPPAGTYEVAPSVSSSNGAGQAQRQSPAALAQGVMGSNILSRNPGKDTGLINQPDLSTETSSGTKNSLASEAQYQPTPTPRSDSSPMISSQATQRSNLNNTTLSRPTVKFNLPATQVSSGNQSSSFVAQQSPDGAMQSNPERSVRFNLPPLQPGVQSIPGTGHTPPLSQNGGTPVSPATFKVPGPALSSQRKPVSQLFPPPRSKMPNKLDNVVRAPAPPTIDLTQEPKPKVSESMLGMRFSDILPHIQNHSNDMHYYCVDFPTEGPGAEFYKALELWLKNYGKNNTFFTIKSWEKFIEYCATKGKQANGGALLIHHSRAKDLNELKNLRSFLNNSNNNVWLVDESEVRGRQLTKIFPTGGVVFILPSAFEKDPLGCYKLLKHIQSKVLPNKKSWRIRLFQGCRDWLQDLYLDALKRQSDEKKRIDQGNLAQSEIDLLLETRHLSTKQVECYNQCSKVIGEIIMKYDENGDGEPSKLVEWTSKYINTSDELLLVDRYALDATATFHLSRKFIVVCAVQRPTSPSTAKPPTSQALPNEAAPSAIVGRNLSTEMTCFMHCTSNKASETEAEEYLGRAKGDLNLAVRLFEMAQKASAAGPPIDTEDEDDDNWTTEEHRAASMLATPKSPPNDSSYPSALSPPDDRAEAEAKAKSEAMATAKAEEKSKAEAEHKAKIEAEEKAKAKAKADSEAASKSEFMKPNPPPLEWISDRQNQVLDIPNKPYRHLFFMDADKALKVLGSQRPSEPAKPITNSAARPGAKPPLR